MAHDVKVDDDSAIRSLLGQVAPGFEASIKRHIQPIVDRVPYEWPVDSGRSRDGFELRYGIEGGAPYAEIRNAVPYSADVRPSKGARASVMTLLEQPVRAAADLILDDVVKALG